MAAEICQPRDFRSTHIKNQENVVMVDAARSDHPSSQVRQEGVLPGTRFASDHEWSHGMNGFDLNGFSLNFKLIELATASSVNFHD